VETQIEILLGSIVEQDVDVIANSANTDMIMGTGIAAAILAEAGSEVEEEAKQHAPVSVGEVVVTAAGSLAAESILHVAVVGDVPPDIYDCTVNLLEAAAELGARSIAMPALGTGSAGIDAEESARAMGQAISDTVVDGSTSLERIVIVIWDDELLATYEEHVGRVGTADFEGLEEM
jgi:serine/threonine-protein kinase